MPTGAARTPIMPGPSPATADHRARAAWLTALRTHVRAPRPHQAAAALHTRLKHPERAAVETHRAAAEQAAFDAALVKHPEWAGDAGAWPDTDAPAAGLPDATHAPSAGDEP